jgi:hypothetical protein
MDAVSEVRMAFKRHILSIFKQVSYRIPKYVLMI